MRIERRAGAACAGLCSVLLTACPVGQHHASDSSLEQNLLQHEAQFEALRVDMQADDKLEMIGRSEVRYANRLFTDLNSTPDVEREGFTHERWQWYQQQLRELGLAQAYRGADGVTFKVDQGSITNGDSYKGYEYDATPPQNQKLSLDGYRISEADRNSSGGYRVTKPIKGHWYLYLFVNGS